MSNAKIKVKHWSFIAYADVLATDKIVNKVAGGNHYLCNRALYSVRGIKFRSSFGGSSYPCALGLRLWPAFFSLGRYLLRTWLGFVIIDLRSRSSAFPASTSYDGCPGGR